MITKPWKLNPAWKLETVQQIFENYRRNPKNTGMPLPDRLWDYAIPLVMEFDIEQVAQTLKLDVNDLKARIKNTEDSKFQKTVPDQITFVEAREKSSPTPNSEISQPVAWPLISQPSESDPRKPFFEKNDFVSDITAPAAPDVLAIIEIKRPDGISMSMPLSFFQTVFESFVRM